MLYQRIKHKKRLLFFYISLVFSIERSVLSQCNTRLRLLYLLNNWKCAKVTPLFKEANRVNLNNYRPILVISVVAKAFERITYDQLFGQPSGAPYAYSKLKEFLMVIMASGIARGRVCTTAMTTTTATWSLARWRPSSK